MYKWERDLKLIIADLFLNTQFWCTVQNWNRSLGFSKIGVGESGLQQNRDTAKHVYHH